MKKFYILVSLTLCFLILAACGSAKQTKSNIKEGEVSYVDMLPSDDIFENGEFTIIDSDGGTMYAFYVSDYTDDEYDEYVSECKELGFNDIVYELDSRYGAYSEDGKYWVQLCKESNGTLTIICNESKNK